jgi:hypothetical protein
MKKNKQEVQGMLSVDTVTQSILLLRGHKSILNCINPDLIWHDNMVDSILPDIPGQCLASEGLEPVYSVTPANAGVPLKISLLTGFRHSPE